MIWGDIIVVPNKERKEIIVTIQSLEYQIIKKITYKKVRSFDDNYRIEKNDTKRIVVRTLVFLDDQFMHQKKKNQKTRITITPDTGIEQSHKSPDVRSPFQNFYCHRPTS